jgi:hypothetical protein
MGDHPKHGEELSEIERKKGQETEANNMTTE